MGELVFIQDKKVVTDSLTVSETFTKRHDRVLQDVREMNCSEEFSLHHFVESTYTNDRGREFPKILMDEQGFTLLAMGYTGNEAMNFKEQYINEFHKMREHLNKPMSIEDMIITQAKSVKELKDDVKQLKSVVDNEVWLTERQKKDVQDSVSRRVFELRRKGHDAHFQTLYSSLKRFFGVSKYDKIPRKDHLEAINYINGWYPPIKKDYAESR